MAYKFIRITTLYPEFISQYRLRYQRFIDTETSYSKLYEHLVGQSWDTASATSKYLNRIGVVAENVYTNVPWLQNAWCRENGVGLLTKDVLGHQIRHFKPDVVWFDSPSMVSDKWLADIKASVKSIKVITGLICAPYNWRDLSTLKEFSFIVTCTPCLQNDLLKHGMKAELIYHGFDEELVSRVTIDNPYPEEDLIFTGSLYTGGGYHKTRIEYLERFVKENVQVKIYGKVDSTKKVLGKIIAYYAINFTRTFLGKRNASSIPVLRDYADYGDTRISLYSSRLKQSLAPPIYGLDQFKVLSRARICFNLHGEVAGKCAGNLRLFEATGVGSCLLTDRKKNMNDLFESDTEVLTYGNQDECLEKINWILKNPSEADRIRIAGQKRVLRDHTLKQRAQQINSLLVELMK